MLNAHNKAEWEPAVQVIKHILNYHVEGHSFFANNELFAKFVTPFPIFNGN